MEHSEQIFLEAVQLLKQGSLVAFPTETVYGLGARVFCKKAIQEIFLVKERPSDNPLIVHVCSLEEVLKLARDIPRNFYRLAEAFWPGPLTIVLKKRKEVPDMVSAFHPTVAVRMPAHPIALRLIRAVEEPLVAPSANVSGRPSPTRACHVIEDFGDKIPLVLDGGESSIGIESTVLYLGEGEPVLLRPGSIDRVQLESVLQTSVRLSHKEDPVCSPGMRYRHYAPKAEVKLFLTQEEVPLDHPYLLSSKPLLNAIVFNRRNFYSLLREADKQKVAQMAIYCDPLIQQDAGLMNRIFRCAGFFT